MYYEARRHERRNVESAEEAARLIHEEGTDLRDYQALVWLGENGHQFAAVADGHINNIWKEVAVIDLDESVQIDSITFGWIGTLEEKQAALKACSSIEREFRMGKCRLPLDGSHEQSQAWFICTCCGEDFKSTIEKQSKYDQDVGYGWCPSCEHWVAHLTT